MKILLVSPPYHRLKGKRMPATYMLGIGYLASALEAAGFDTVAYNMNLPAPSEPANLDDRKAYLVAVAGGAHPAWDELRSVLDKEEPDVLGVTVMTFNLGAALEVSRIAKKVHSGIRIIWGGPHASACPVDCLSYGSVDFVVRGEGEDTIVDLCRDIEAGGKGENTAGVSLREEKGVRQNADRPPIKDLDSLPCPDRTRLLFGERFAPSEMAIFLTSRGCPFRCGFCGGHVTWGRKVRFHSVGRVEREVDTVLSSLKPERLVFQDDCFTLRRERVAEIAAAMEPRKVKWHCYTRADLLDRDILRVLRASGCTSIGIGLESGSPRILEILSKGERLETIKEGILAAKAEGFFLNIFVMFGLPGETRSDVEATLRVLEELGADNISAGIFGPLPGTALTETCKEMDLLPAEVDWLALSNSEFGLKMQSTGPLDSTEFARIMEDMFRFINRYKWKRLPRRQKVQRAIRKVGRLVTGWLPSNSARG